MDQEESKKLIEKYELSTDEIDEVSKRVVTLQVANLTTQERPVIIFTGGQSGGGKSSITDLQKERLNQDVAIVDADRYRGSHPKAEEIGNLYKSIASSLTHQAGARISNKVRDAAFDKGANIIFDQTSRTPDGIKIIGDRAKAKDIPYDVELHVIATDLDTSRMRVHGRYENGGGAPGGGRYVDEDFQKKSYQGVADTVKTIEDEKAVDRLVIYNRNGKPIYDNSLKNGEWQNKPKAHETLLNERERELSILEKKELAQGWQKIKFQMDQRQASISEPNIVKIAQEGMQKATDRHGLQIRDAEIVKAGRTYSGEIKAESNDHILQQKNNGAGYIHPKSSLNNLTDADMNKAVKISYDRELQGSITTRESVASENKKEIKHDRSMER